MVKWSAHAEIQIQLQHLFQYIAIDKHCRQ